MERRLSGQPDLGYLLREYYDLYRGIASGGSKPIRAHQRDVRATIARLVKADPPAGGDGGEGTSLPVLAHLRRALNQGRMGRMEGVVMALETVVPSLRWEQGYERMPRRLARDFAYSEIVGATGPVRSDAIRLGVVLFAPGCTYPAHAHDHITESYVCLSGAISENDQGVYVPGSMIFNPPGTVHRITVSDRDPALLAYAWTGPPEILSSNRMILGRSSRAG